MAASMQARIRNVVASSLLAVAQGVGVGKALLPVAVTVIRAGIAGVGRGATAAGVTGKT